MVAISYRGQRISQWRSEQGIVQGKLAEMLGITGAHLSDIERGVRSPSLSLAELIAEKTGVPIGEFFNSSYDEDGVCVLQAASKEDRQIDIGGSITLRVKLKITKNGEVCIMGEDAEKRDSINITAEGQHSVISMDIFRGATIGEIRAELAKAMDMALRQAEVYARV